MASVAGASASSSEVATRAARRIALAPAAIASAVGVGVALRIDQHQPRQSHRLHRARARADISRMAGRAKHDEDPFKRRGHGCRQSADRMRVECAAPIFFARALRMCRAAHFIMHPMLSTAVKAARRAGSIINRGARDLDRLTVTAKGPKDFVSEVDRAAEAAIVEILLATYPDHAILAEEGTAKGANADAEYLWIIDPLDGTTNFLHGFPQYCVSIALQHKGQVTQGVIYDPVRNDLFTATRGPRRVSERSSHARLAAPASAAIA